jgi:hypothetical protein
MNHQQVTIKPGTGTGALRSHEVMILGIGKCGSNLILSVDEELMHRDVVDAMACHPGYHTPGKKNGAMPVTWEDRFSFEDDHPLSVKEKIEKQGEVWEIVMDLASGSNLMILAGGIGGITGSNGISTIAEFFGPGRTKVISFVVMPFKGEGEQCRKNAEACLADLKRYCDVVVVVSNQRLLEIHPAESLGTAFARINALFEQMVRKILDAGSSDDIDFVLDDPDGLSSIYVKDNSARGTDADNGKIID